MATSITRSIESMEKVCHAKETPLSLYIDKEQGCILTTADKAQACPMYEIADWVQHLSNQCRASHLDAPENEDLKRLNKIFQKLWENYISEISLSR